METQMAYCSACDQEVHIAVTPLPLHDGQANLPEGTDVVCLDFGQRCTGQFCPMFGLPTLTMAVRLARSELRAEGWKKVKGLCQGCDQVTEMDLLDQTHAYCTVCHTTNRCALVQLGEDDYILVVAVADPAPGPNAAT